MLPLARRYARMTRPSATRRPDADASRGTPSRVEAEPEEPDEVDRLFTGG